MDQIRFQRLAAALVAAVMVAGCDPAPVPLAPVAAPQVLCQGVPQNPCRQAFDVSGAAPGTVAQIVVRCAVPVCTVASGEANVIIFYIDGRQDSSGYAWAAAAPAPMPAEPPEPPVPLTVEPVCVGVPAESCIEMATSAVAGLPRGGPAVASITVRCTAVCTPTNGEGETVVQFADGTSTTSGWGYSSGGG